MSYWSCRALGRCHLSGSPQCQLHIHPYQLRDWEDCLANRPDPRFTAYITNGIHEGFRISYDYQSHSCKRVRGNMCSAADHPEVVQEYIAKECAEGRTMEPFDPSKLPEVQTTRFRVIPKRNSNGWQLILDLSSPEGWSMNDGINPDLCSLFYVTIDDATRAIVESDPGSKLALRLHIELYRYIRRIAHSLA